MELTDNSQIAKLFQSGKIGVFPTDTAFGIGCRMDNVESIEKIFKMRKRPETKPLLVLVSSIEMAEKYLRKIPDDVRKKLMDTFWPGGLTIILPCKVEEVASIVRSGGDTLAVRLPNHKQLLEVIEKVGVPIVAPSANFSGEATPFTLSELDPELLQQVDFVMKGECTTSESSTIIDCSVTQWRIIRPGAVKIKL